MLQKEGSSPKIRVEIDLKGPFSGSCRRNGRNGNKRRERHELPPNVDNLPSFSLKEMQGKILTISS